MLETPGSEHVQKQVRSSAVLSWAMEMALLPTIPRQILVDFRRRGLVD